MATKWKPFKIPALTRRPLTPEPDVEVASPTHVSGEPPLKRRRTSEERPPAYRIAPPKPAATRSVHYSQSSSFASQNENTTRPSQHRRDVNDTSALPDMYYNVLWRKPTTKKNKTWGGDAILVLRNNFVEMYSTAGKELGRRPFAEPLLPGSELKIFGKELEVESRMSLEQYHSWRDSVRSTGQPTMKQLSDNLRENVGFQAHKAKVKPLQVTAVNIAAQKPSKVNSVQKTSQVAAASRPPITPINANFKSPLIDQSFVTTRNSVDGAKPRHDPGEPDAIVMRRPDRVSLGQVVVDVVVDPFIGRRLREHQKQGVKFLYECIMGMKGLSGEGAVLGDEMGLGKTLQVIALLWTLMKQNPIAGQAPTIKKALIVCPVTTINNWRKEFRKWLGNERLGIFAYDEKDKRIRDFTHGRSYNVMIIGYERLRSAADELQKADCIDIVIMDEVHRLKTAKDKSAQAIKSLSTQRRIGLSGTILQNNLSELYFVVDLINPGMLGKPSAFKRRFEATIERGRETDATRQEREKADEREKELLELTANFTLRRRADILAKYLPPKTEYVLFCRPTDAQAAVYRQILRSPIFASIIGSSDASLQLITILKKLCNSPVLLREPDRLLENDAASTSSRLLSSLLADVSPKLLNSPGASGKLRILDSLLHQIRSKTDEKVIIVSNYTQTLDILSNLLTSLSYNHARLDGSTPAGRRQQIIDTFNRATADQQFAFLLSAKSGGAGINLVGASRLILFDVDWNPATDLQAMARIHREGQRRECRIYRLLTLGALDEKIYQRQLVKISLSDAVVDGKVSASGFTRDELRRLFTLDESQTCQTHELLGCECQGRGLPDEHEIEKAMQAFDDRALDDAEGDSSSLSASPSKSDSFIMASQIDASVREEDARRGKKQRAKMLALMSWDHIDTSVFHAAEFPAEEMEKLVDDEALRSVLSENENRVSYLFSKTSGGEKIDSDVTTAS